MGWLKRMTQPDIRRHLLRDEGEDIVDIVRKHWVVYIIPMLIAYLALVAFAAFLFSNLETAWVPLLLGFVLLGWGASRALAHHLDCFVITNMRVFRIHGVLSGLSPRCRSGGSSTSPWSSRWPAASSATGTSPSSRPLSPRACSRSSTSPGRTSGTWPSSASCSAPACAATARS